MAFRRRGQVHLTPQRAAGTSVGVRLNKVFYFKAPSASLVSPPGAAAIGFLKSNE